MFDTKTGSIILEPDQVEGLLVLPTLDNSITAQITNTVRTSKHRVRFPRLVEDPTAQWTEEGSEIKPSQPKFDEVVAELAKVAGLVIVTNEMLNDGEDHALNQIGNGLVRQLTNSIDEAFFTALADPAPQGLTSITPTALDVGGELDGLDWAEEALALAATAGSRIDHFVCHPSTALTLALLKESTGSNRGLLQPNPASPTVRDVGGVPLITTTHVEEGVIWGIPKENTHLVVRHDAEVISDGSALFTSDRVAIRGTMRVGFAFPHEPGVVKITHAVEPAA